MPAMIPFTRGHHRLDILRSVRLAEPPIRAREQLNSVRWLQTATEYRAASLQIYRAAARELEVLRSVIDSDGAHGGSRLRDQ